LKIGIGSKPGIDAMKKLFVTRSRFMYSFRMNYKHFVPAVVTGFTIFLFAGCQSPKEQCRAETPAQTTTVTAAPVTPAPVAAPTTAPVATPAPVVAPAPAATPASAPMLPSVRIKAGLSTPFTDSEGNVWLPDQGFTDGDTYEVSDVQIANTKTPAIYRTERYSMTSFSYPVPNGKYAVKLHFAEVYDAITGPGMRVFSFNVEGHEFKDFDIWVKAGGSNRAYVETVDVEVTNGKLDIAFTPEEENPKINGIEILPRS
jgi:hypothetical protein